MLVFGLPSTSHRFLYFVPAKTRFHLRHEPVPTVFPAIAGADISAVFVGKRIAGDFYDSIRVNPERVLIGLLDVAGRREDNRSFLANAQSIFRKCRGRDILAAGH